MRILAAALLLVTFAGRVEADTKSATAWSVEVKPDNAFVDYIRFASDGDIIVAGNSKGPFALGDAKPVGNPEATAFVARVTTTGAVRWLRAVDRKEKHGESRSRGLAIAADGTILFDVSTGTTLTRVTFSADGATQRSETLMETTGFPSTAIVGTDSIVIGASPANTTCKEIGLPVYRVKVGGAIAWSACNNTKTEIVQAHHITSLADGRSAACVGPAVMAFSANGKRTLNAMHAEDAICEGVSIAKDGQVAALLEGVEKTMVIATWKSNGKAGWKKSCTDLIKGESRCSLTAIAVDGTDLLVGAHRYAEKASIVRLDAKTGAIKATYPLGSQVFTTLGANKSAVYHASNKIPLGRL